MDAKNALRMHTTGCTEALTNYFNNAILVPVGYSTRATFFYAVNEILMNF